MVKDNTGRTIALPQVPAGLDRPYVVINCAASADGKLALPDGRQTRISSNDDIAHVHALRNWADAIVVGINTVIADDPKLTVKKKFVTSPTQPLRVVVDSCIRTPPGSEVFSASAPTLIAHTGDTIDVLDLPTNIEFLPCGEGERVDLRVLLDHLWAREIRTVMVEGGGTLISSFLEEGLVDEFQIFIGDMIIGGKGSPSPVMGKGAQDLQRIIPLDRYATHPMVGGIRIHYRSSR